MYFFNYFLFVMKYDFLLKFTFLLLLYFGKVKKFKIIVKAKSAMRKLARMVLAQSGYGSGLLPLVYYTQNFNSFNSTFTRVYFFQ